MTVGEVRAHDKELQALVSVGMLRVKEAKLVREKTDHYVDTGNQVEVKSYEVTEAGQKFYLDIGLHKDLCYAQAIPVTIVKWEGPMQRGSHEVVDVTFKRKVGELADWAKGEQFKDVFSVKQALREISEDEATATLKRTSEGWEAL
ncbi:hypothetical protein D0T21_28465 [Duganella sp. BJB476]|nr:hypothetical protein D0T21_28465 [Duganella sp. BJB476]